jgi:hypothetical protein
MVKERVHMNMETNTGFHTTWWIYLAAYWILAQDGLSVGRNLSAGKIASFFKTKEFVAIRTYSLYVEEKT